MAPRSAGGGKGKAAANNKAAATSSSKGRQLALTSFFQATPASAAKGTTNDSKAAAAKPEYSVNTRVKKRLDVDGKKNDNQEAVYVNGKIVECIQADDKKQPAFTYRVCLETTNSSDEKETLQEVWTAEQVQWGVLLHRYIGANIAKEFEVPIEEGSDEKIMKRFQGKVTSIYEDDDGTLYYWILYLDGDQEELTQEELQKGMQEYEQYCSLRAITSTKKTTKRAPKKTAASKVTDENLANNERKKTPRASGPRRAAGRAGVVDKKDTDEDLVDSEPKSTPGRSSPRRASRSRINYKEGDDDDDEDFEEQTPKASIARKRPSRAASHRRRIIEEDESDEEMEHGDDDDDAMDVEDEQTKSATNRKRAASNTRKKVPSKKTKTTQAKKKSSEDDSDFSDDDAADDDLEEDLLEMEDDEESGAKDKKPKGARAKSTRNSSLNKAYQSDKMQELETKMQKERIAYKNPVNNPQVMPSKPYVDPVGVDPTHGIVESIIAEQVRKVGHLLRLIPLTDARTKTEAGELTFPIRLQTACSGTDAPSIALGLIKESLDKLYKDDKTGQGHGFEYSHEMSCEIEPFKQAYIGRNFPGVPLFPDITKLTASEKVVDVYGRPHTLPTGNLFVAGTSCKDFSMLKTRDRLDIEDKGTSGETFLAAVEFLEAMQPPYAIFENVDGAPWAKMQEYITGRIDLSQRNETKAIKGPKKADADAELKFSVNNKNKYVAEEVPRQVGMRAGSVVRGFVKGGDDVTQEIPLAWDGPKPNRFVTLGEIARRHKINLDQDTLVMEKKARYCTHLCKLDTKEYGLPQTRNRKYLHNWNSDDPDDDLGVYTQELLDYLKTPLLHSMDAFLLPDSHDRIRCFREALRSGPGLMVKRERAKEPDFFDWELSNVQDLPRHLVFREKNGIGERSRWLTGWDTRGRKALAPGLWPELFDCWNMRRLDMIDCFAAASVRDAIPRDPMHHFFTWDLSQNVTRAPFRTATVGVSGCVTPGGELLMPHKGRTVMGYEKLLLQGIPFSRLLLGPETEVQLSDLAGNAMSVSVISATMLAAMCAPQLRRERNKSLNIALASFRLLQKHDAADGGVLAERGDLHGCMKIDVDKRSSFSEVFGSVAAELAEEAYWSSVLCCCESSGATTKDPKILQCVNCGLSICHECSSRHQTETHALKEIDCSSRPDAHLFERKLRCALPSVLRIGEGWEDVVKYAGGLESYSFQLQQVERKSGHWELFYGAWEDFGSSRQVAEIRVDVGKTQRLESEFGVAAYLRCFAPAIRHVNPERGPLLPHARLLLRASGATSRWELPLKCSKTVLNIVGTNPCPSQRVQVGLTDEACEAFKKHKVARNFLPSIQSRNSLIQYHPKWKTWPGTLEISGDTTGLVNGKYDRMRCHHTVVHSALWRKDGSGNFPTLYLLFRPDVLRSGLDVAVISTSPSYQDTDREVCELLDWIPENALTERTQHTEALFKKWEFAPDSLSVCVMAPSMHMVMKPESFHENLCNQPIDGSGVVLCELNGLSPEIIESLLEYNGSKGKGGFAQIDLEGRSRARNGKRLSVIAAPSLLKYAAEDKLPLTFSKWYRLPPAWKFGHCEINVPSRPVERWRTVDGRKVKNERFYDPEESNQYYQKLHARPPAFRVEVSASDGQLVVAMNPCVAAHNAAARLGGEPSALVEVDYCLSELSSMGEPDTKEFRVPNSDAYQVAVVQGLELPLYPRQAKALSRMIAIERGDVHFSEEERSEHILPGIGWCLIARAAKKSPLRGGVLGDAIGSGKTVITIALILHGSSDARKNRDSSKGRSGASLVVVPPGLVKQWDDERKKFTKDKLNCITIDSTATLLKFSVEDLCSADMVIVPADIIEEGSAKGASRPYTQHLSKKAGASAIPAAPTHYSQREAPTIEGTWVRNMSSGPEIYVGNNGSQQAKDLQAYYGHCYSEAIAKLRSKTFRPSEKGVPLEYFTWERIITDECHETLVTGRRHEIDDDSFKAKARRGAREFLGVAQTDISKRPLRAAKGVWGLTGTPLLETEARVTELANLMGGTYLTGAAHHWRKEERESGRDIFLNQQEATKSREYRRAVQEACHSYVEEACQRNRGEQLEIALNRSQHEINMSDQDGAEFLKETSDVDSEIADAGADSFAVTADQLGERADAVLRISAQSEARRVALGKIIDSIHQVEPETKVIVFANSTFGGYGSALRALEKSRHEFCHLSDQASVHEQNEIISWFRHVDATDEDRARPRVLLLSFEQAAGHNLQEACHNVVIFDPMYSGGDAVADASVEEQAVGRVMRQGQKSDVTVTRIVVKGPNGERCLDDWLIERNLDENVLQAATSNFD